MNIKYFPLKKVKFNKYKHCKSKWIASGILESILFKGRLQTKLKATPLNSDQYETRKINYQTYKKILRHSINLAKKKYYYNCFDKFKSDVRKTWSLINEALNRNKSQTDFPEYFEINGMKVSNKQVIANKLNKYFTEIGPTLAQSTPQLPGRSYMDYLTKPLPITFKF